MAKFKINGVEHELDIEPEMPLLWASEYHGHASSVRELLATWACLVRALLPHV